MDVEFRVTRAGVGTTLRPGTEAADNGLWPSEILVETGAALDLRIEVELGAAVGYWHPEAGEYRTLPPDWAATTSTSLVCGAPVGCLYDAAGESLFGWALNELVDELEIGYGVSEEHKTFAVELRARAVDTERRLVLLAGTRRMPLAELTATLATWLAGGLETSPLPVPEVARRPVYSTWYTFTQELDQAGVEAETVLGTQLGIGSVFVDDGWQRLAFGRGYGGCGDWVPDTDKFPDLAGFSATARQHGAGVVLWIAPLLLGPDADVFDSLAEYAPHRVDRLRCHVLDPRHRQVREHLAATCVRLVVDYDLAGLKIDFLDDAMVYRGTDSTGDLNDVGHAMQALLQLIRAELAAVGREDLAIEFRQPYVSPAIAAYGQILRAADCPGDAVVNRRRTVDSRLLTAGQVVHGDMLMWGPTGGAEAVAQQLYGCWFSVPQISMKLSDLSAEQSEALAGLLELWQQLAPVALDGSLSVWGAERCYDLIQADRTDLGRRVIGRYVPTVVDLDAAGEVTILNAVSAKTVVVRVAAGLTISSGVVRNASAGVLIEVGPLGSGLQEISVPPFGSLTLTVTGQ
ncbi:MAG: alpha-galactosidase [Microlunatus sp.]